MLRAPSSRAARSTAAALHGAGRRPAAAPARPAVVCRAGFFSKLFGGGADNDSNSMGAAGSTPSPSSAAAGSGSAVSKLGYPLTISEDEKKRAAAELTDLQRYVTLQQGTERAFTGKTVDGAPHDNKRKGVYVSAVGGLPLFSSEDKFDSGTGWPSFVAPVSDDHVELRVDRSVPFMPRTEVVDKRSGAHLGHVFDDGPRGRGGKRFCINAAALRFVPEGEELPLKPVGGEGKGKL
jgi:peptide-methionine (R)-S-oxide reductase